MIGSGLKTFSKGYISIAPNQYLLMTLQLAKIVTKTDYEVIVNSPCAYYPYEYYKGDYICSLAEAEPVQESYPYYYVVVLPEVNQDNMYYRNIFTRLTESIDVIMGIFNLNGGFQNHYLFADFYQLSPTRTIAQLADKVGDPSVLLVVGLLLTNQQKQEIGDILMGVDKILMITSNAAGDFCHPNVLQIGLMPNQYLSISVLIAQKHNDGCVFVRTNDEYIKYILF